MPKIPSPARRGRTTGSPRRRGAGFSLVELLIGMAMLAFGLLAVAALFSTGYTDAAAGGKTTMAVAAARQIMEDIRALPFVNLPLLNPGGVAFDTNVPGSQPVANPERGMARKWRYALAGDGPGWGLSGAEVQNWSTLAMMGADFLGRAQVTVVDDSPTLRRITVTVTLQGQPTSAQLVTLISRL